MQIRFGQLHLDEASIRRVAGDEVLQRLQQAKKDFSATLTLLRIHDLDIFIRGKEPDAPDDIHGDSLQGLWADVKDSHGYIVADKSFLRKEEVGQHPLQVLDNAIMKAFDAVILNTGRKK
jgi:hypothetical protein